MAVAKTLSVTLLGIDAQLVEVEVDVATGLPGFVLTALSDRVLTQLVHRIRSAVTNSGGSWPSKRITVGLSPAAVPKAGSGFDLPVACALLVADEALPRHCLEGLVLLGELGLDGRVHGITGALPAVIGAVRAGARRVVVPSANVQEARLVPGADVVGVSSLAELCAWLRGDLVEPSGEPDEVVAAVAERVEPDLADVLGQAKGRRVMEVAAAGGHHVFLGGPPGVGKTMLAERLPGLLPDLDPDEALEVTAIHSRAGRLPAGSGLITRPPYAAPHHSATLAAIVGGGSRIASPGLVSLAHRGVLFLDEAPEFARPVLDALRQPLESGRITLARAAGVVSYPCRFQLALAANPCPCATAGRDWRPSSCVCSSVTRRTYGTRLSGPLRDRVDLVVELDAVSREVLTAGTVAESSAAVRRRVEAARDRARRRFAGTPWTSVGEVPGPLLRRHWPVPDSAIRSMLATLERHHLSTRGYDRLMRVSWTLADLAGRDQPAADDVAEAFALRAGSWQAPRLEGVA